MPTPQGNAEGFVYTEPTLSHFPGKGPALPQATSHRPQIESDFHFVEAPLAPRAPPTIIVPIFNGWPAVTACVDSLLATTPQDVPIRLIDDASTDPRVQDWLKALDQESNPRLTLVRHEQNHGYLRRVNECIESLSGDVILANSDTRFSPGWFDALCNAAMDPAVGIANPISNNATILSVSGLEDLDDRQRRALRERFRSCWYEIPTAVGFCMYLKRDTIKRCGVFDALFDPGYGEECDYSMRLRRQGLRIAAVPSSIVFHEGSRSFRERADDLKSLHARLVSLRWPDYDMEVQRFARHNPIRAIQEFVHACRSPASSRVLHVMHAFDYLGGIELFTKELLARFSSDTEHVILCPGRVDDAWLDFDESAFSPQVRVLRFDPGRFSYRDVAMAIPAGLEHPGLDAMFRRLVTGGDFNCVTFHSLVRLGTLSWPAICRDLGIPYQLCVHEFFHLCHDYNMTQGPDDLGPCGKTVCHESDQDCLTCLGARIMRLDQPLPRYMQKRRGLWQAIFADAHTILTNGPLVTESIAAAYGETLRPRIREFEPYFYAKGQASGHRVNPIDSPLHVAYLGAFSPRKGGLVFLDACRRLKGENTRWSVIGNVDDRLKPALAESGVPFTGAYDRLDLPELLRDVDVVIQAATWSETYNRTTSEAWEQGCPVIAPAIGAFTYRIKDGVNGWLYPAGDAQALAERVRMLAQARGRQQLNAISGNALIASARDNPAPRVLEKLYRSYPPHSIKGISRERRPNPRRLAEPKRAHDAVADWLDAPMCLESDEDWATPQAFFCLAPEADRPALTRSLACEAPAARCIEAIDLDKVSGEAPVLILQAETHLTPNIGNWLQWWRQSDRPASTCNYLIHDSEQAAYATCFRGDRDATFFRRAPRRWGGVLISAAAAQRLLSGHQHGSVFEAPLGALIQADELNHWDGCALTMLDAHWASLWRVERGELRTPVPSDPLPDARRPRLTVIVQAGRWQDARRALAGLHRQRGIDLIHTTILSLDDGPSAEQLESDAVSAAPWRPEAPDECINRAVEAQPESDGIIFLGDNVQLEDTQLIANLARTLVNNPIDAISPMTASDRRGDRYLARRAGVGSRGLPGYLDTHALETDSNTALLPADCLDDDLFLISSKAWRRIAGIAPLGRHFFRAVMLSERLRAAGFALARSSNFVRKYPLPSAAMAANPALFDPERDAVLQALARSKGSSAFSRALSCAAPRTLEHKAHAFKGAHRSSRVLAYAHDVWASGFYRVRAPAAALAAANRISSHFLPEQREARAPNAIEVARAGADTLLLHSFLHDEQLGKLRDYYHALDIPICFSLDDWLIDLPDYNPFSRSNYPDMTRRIRYALRHCHRLIVPTQTLADLYGELATEIRVVPNRIPEALVRPLPETRSGRLRIGWIGAPQHAGDLAWLAPIVRNTADRMDWVFFGQKPEGIMASHCEFHPAVPLKAYFEKLGALELDMAVAPLVDNVFNSAKSNLKLIEYAALGLPVVCSDCTAYRHSPAIRLENDEATWTETLLRLAGDSDQRRSLSLAMRSWLSERHILENHLDDWRNALLF